LALAIVIGGFRHRRADSAYAGDKLLNTYGNRTIEILLRMAGAVGFAILPGHRVVEPKESLPSACQRLGATGVNFFGRVCLERADRFRQFFDSLLGDFLK
jgi:hypothetical protein